MDDRKFRRIAQIAERTCFFGSVIFMNLFFLGLIFPGIYFLGIPKNAWAEPPCHVHVRVHSLGVNKKNILLFFPDFKYKVDSFNLCITDNYVKRTIGRCKPRVENIKNH